MQGDITVNINSPGGDVFAAAQIYNMLRNHKGKVKVFIDSLAASAASVVAMAGDEVEISPVGMIMIHNPSTMTWGDHNELEKAVNTLNEIKESIINAYERKTHLSRQEISDLMEAETWMNANTAKEKGFVDKITGDTEAANSFIFGAKAADKALFNKVVALYEGEIPDTDNGDEPETEPETKEAESGTPVSEINARLNAIKTLI